MNAYVLHYLLARFALAGTLLALDLLLVAAVATGLVVVDVVVGAVEMEKAIAVALAVFVVAVAVAVFALTLGAVVKAVRSVWKARSRRPLPVDAYQPQPEEVKNDANQPLVA